MKDLQLDTLGLIKRLEVVLKKGFTHEVMAGNYRSVFKGRGMEFVGFRDYDPSDDAMLIDWKASLRVHKPMVRQLEEERNLTVFFLIDVSESMLFSSHKKLKCEYAAEVVGTMTYAIHSVGDSVGIAMFSDKVIHFLHPGMGRNQFFKIMRSLKNGSYYGGKCNLDLAIRFLFDQHIIKPDSVLFIVSDFIGMPTNWEHSLLLAGLRYDLTCVCVRDPVDMHLPPVHSTARFGDPYSDKHLTLDPSEAKEQYEGIAQEQIDKLNKELKKTQSSMLYLETNILYTPEVLKYFLRRKQFKA